ncbi:Probable GTP pyrophosphokinase [Mycobacteroides abscessus]|uniref:Guanosine-3,5-bis(Diphosphate) 3-diphosphatase n=3 Tax=Mycobacteroides abscessus TaxID=36809 RepID=A0A829HY17_9MYCO|nr:HD domain-containing protein [Mycobacteroides abscessus]ESV58720.1 HD domain protein [Mycobacteroides abscessus MAB_082312_2258]ESV62105.1 HD domain protein [Mycobacteroides abscessus MAB_091912_2446]AIC72739.1 guanosine-3,5-bis(Diphosphate) 3-diphosphatase [Mycobacteroides abscessus subsp. massiliense str. GO 06]AMU24935.1 guanosine-3',5'-bis(diphosphate) 3'-pyrophosphohydrolase [Mycobacteroides abscessus]AMU34664.1 guanosine-3',5'-bis(diphosphate) 3'-pyrophosphohydrolase [Mycobacteroides 
MAASSDIIDQARQLAEQAHAGQTDKAGEPYIGHVIRVAASVLPQESIYIAAALLHDVVEDSGVTLDNLAAQGFPLEVVTAVGLLTRQKDVPSKAYYGQIKNDPIALAVKLADIADNSDPVRLAKLDTPTRERLIIKYRDALLSLGQPAHATGMG